MQRVKPTRKLSQPVAILILVAVLAIIGVVIGLLFHQAVPVMRA